MLNREQIAARVALELQNGESVYLDPSWAQLVVAALAPSVRISEPSAPGQAVDVAVLAVSAVSHLGEFSSGPLAHPAKRIIAVLEQHQGADGAMHLVASIAPATGTAQRVITDMAVFEVTAEGLVMHEVAPGVSALDVQRKSDTPLLAADDLRVVHV
ncbi:MAG: scoB2 [Myxococcaceae bacterium]|nr:scoB2 [Myxococcaceae bacterium]